ncbi:MAG: S1 RNA-binding domain-containing protein [Chloroflexi bacterium]|nr:S1 RNA-binding domain-containing protein [Chloroflexota bacterium]
MNDRENNYLDKDSRPEQDESWWAAVFSDEFAVTAEKKEINCRPCRQPGRDGEINWECIQKIFTQDEVVLLTVYGHNRGGLLVKGEGIQGFVPMSHLVDLPIDAIEETKQLLLSQYEGKSLYVKVIECEPSNERAVFSERAAQAGEGKRKELFGSLEPGVLVCGMVTNVTEFGIFVDLGGVEGLVHVSELSWGRVEHPAHFFHIGQQVKVMVLLVNEATSRIALSIKRLSSNPWEGVVENYRAGDTVNAEVTSIRRLGVFARLEEGIEGLIHVSTISIDGEESDLSSVFSVGQGVKVKILHIDADRRRLGLGLVTEK